ncbi:MAG TPA: hypothetical protein VNV43_14700 [Candidatus Acidoferrales bacterium]|nr:hypothetical protein [Candidatus Acidoferrales bacterium]
MKASLCLGLLACILSCKPAIAQRPDWRASFVPYDPWRAIGGQTNYVKMNGVEFCGKIVDITRDGIRIEGDWGLLGTLYYPPNGWGNYAHPGEYNDFLITNFPYPAIPGAIIPSDKHLMAWYVGDYTYKTESGGSQTIRKLDYGTPCGPNPVLLAAMQKQKQEARERRREADVRKIEELEHDATKGDSSAQYSLAFHYLHGFGCETNEVLGIFWLSKAAAQGNIEASNDLQAIEFPPTNSVNVHP